MIDLYYFVSLAYKSGKEVVRVWHCYGIINSDRRLPRAIEGSL